MEKIVELALHARSLEELVVGAEESGIPFVNEKSFLRRLKREWMSEKKRTYSADYSGRTLPETIPVRKVNADGKTYEIYGIVHDDLSPVTYKNIIRQTFVGKKKFLTEQNLDLLIPSASTLPIPDHASQKYWLAKTAAESYWGGIKAVISLPHTIGIRFLRVLKKEEPPRELDSDEIYSLFCPPELMFTFPPRLTLELKDRRLSPGYDELEQRSAYQAEFLRRWTGDKTILVGLAHVPQIEYFLKEGCKDQRIVDLVGEHIGLWKRDSEKFRNFHDCVSIKEFAATTVAVYSGAATFCYALFQMIT